jgi:hypothetical protein
MIFRPGEFTAASRAQCYEPYNLDNAKMGFPSPPGASSKLLPKRLPLCKGILLTLSLVFTAAESEIRCWLLRYFG